MKIKILTVFRRGISKDKLSNRIGVRITTESRVTLECAIRDGSLMGIEGK